MGRPIVVIQVRGNGSENEEQETSDNADWIVRYRKLMELVNQLPKMIPGFLSWRNGKFMVLSGNFED